MPSPLCIELIRRTSFGGSRKNIHETQGLPSMIYHETQGWPTSRRLRSCLVWFSIRLKSCPSKVFLKALPPVFLSILSQNHTARFFSPILPSADVVHVGSDGVRQCDSTSDPILSASARKIGVGHFLTMSRNVS